MIRCGVRACLRLAMHVTAIDARERWGGGATLAELRGRLRCEACGARGNVLIDVLGGPRYPMGVVDENDPEVVLWRAYEAWSRSAQAADGS